MKSSAKTRNSGENLSPLQGEWNLYNAFLKRQKLLKYCYSWIELKIYVEVRRHGTGETDTKADHAWAHDFWEAKF